MYQAWSWNHGHKTIHLVFSVQQMHFSKTSNWMVTALLWLSLSGVNVGDNAHIGRPLERISAGSLVAFFRFTHASWIVTENAYKIKHIFYENNYTNDNNFFKWKIKSLFVFPFFFWYFILHVVKSLFFFCSNI